MNELETLRKRLGIGRTEFGKLFGYAFPYQMVWQKETGSKPVSNSDRAMIKALDYMIETGVSERFLQRNMKK